MKTDCLLASFFVEASKQLAKPDKKIPASITRLYSNTNFEAFGLLCFGLHNWQLGDVENARAILGSFLDAKVSGPDDWIEELKPLAADYSFDCEQVATIERDPAGRSTIRPLRRRCSRKRARLVRPSEDRWKWRTRAGVDRASTHRAGRELET